MKLHFHGGARTVTGANYLLETKKGKVVIDCGLFQGGPESEEKNKSDFPYNPKDVEAVFITHSHIDHIGRLPMLVKNGFNGTIYGTEPTKEFSAMMLMDSVNLARQREEATESLYTLADVEKTISLFHGIKYGEEKKLQSGIKFCFRDAGHILGSAIVEIWADDKKIVFSGDLGNPPVPLLKPTEFITEADYVVVESAYGDRVHETKYQRRDLLEDTIEEAVARGGTILIPSFALERTQELLYELNELIENQRIPQIPVFVDSPLAIRLTDIYKKYTDYFNKEAAYLIESGDDLFKFPGLKMTRTVAQSKAINDIKPPKIIIAGSGMSTGGRIRHHEIRYLPDPNSTFLSICYQVDGTLGREIVDGASSVRIFGQKIRINAKIKKISGYSAHADQEDLYFWISKMTHDDGGKYRLKKVFVSQGEEEPAKALAQRIKDHLGISAIAPKLGQSFIL
ncbi:MAG: MBL fold metallo-hydrolase [bacterium]